MRVALQGDSSAEQLPVAQKVVASPPPSEGAAAGEVSLPPPDSLAPPMLEPPPGGQHALTYSPSLPEPISAAAAALSPPPAKGPRKKTGRAKKRVPINPAIHPEEDGLHGQMYMEGKCWARQNTR